MRKLLVTSLIALLALAASAQTAPRSNTQSGTAKTSLTPASSRQGNTASSQKTTVQPSVSKSRLPASTSRSNTNANTGSRTSLSPTTTSNTTTRPSLNNQNSGTTIARGINDNTAKKATDVKVNPVRVKWMTLEEALEKSKTDKRKIFVDVYTDWCGWCKRMDSTTFVNPAVAKYLNDHYYPVKFNAEQQKDIVFKDKTYQFKKSGARGYHELAAEWLNNRLSYPTAVFLDENQGVIQPLPGFQDATKMEAVLNYFGTDSHKKTPWETYMKNFKQEKE